MKNLLSFGVVGCAALLFSGCGGGEVVEKPIDSTIFVVTKVLVGKSERILVSWALDSVKPHSHLVGAFTYSPNEHLVHIFNVEGSKASEQGDAVLIDPSKVCTDLKDLKISVSSEAGNMEIPVPKEVTSGNKPD